MAFWAVLHTSLTLESLCYSPSYSLLVCFAKEAYLFPQIPTGGEGKPLNEVTPAVLRSQQHFKVSGQTLIHWCSLLHPLS